MDQLLHNVGQLDKHQDIYFDFYVVYVYTLNLLDIICDEILIGWYWRRGPG